MIRFFWGLLCVLFPWLVLLLHDNPGGALVALILQATGIGWLPASIWAFRTVKEEREANKGHKKKRTENSPP